MKPLVYVAGPYSHPDPVENTHDAIIACAQLLDDGIVTPICPHLTLTWHLVTPRPYETWIAYDLEVLRRCSALLLLGHSPGADGEWDAARGWGIAVHDHIETLYAWAQGTDGVSNYLDPDRVNVPAVPGLVRERSHGDELTERIAADPRAAASIFYDAYSALKNCVIHHGYDEWNRDANREWEAIGNFMYPDRPTVVDVAERAIES